jgi:hypothetical protein
MVCDAQCTVVLRVKAPAVVHVGATLQAVQTAASALVKARAMNTHYCTDAVEVPLVTARLVTRPQLCARSCRGRPPLVERRRGGNARGKAPHTRGGAS